MLSEHFENKAMKTAYGRAVRLISVVMSLLLIFSIIPMHVFAADSFEKSISAFPESYRVKLRSLHEIYPAWTFEPLVTGIDWNTAVQNECKDDRNLVEEYCSSYIFKSRASGDYNASTGKYIYKDGNFVTASEQAVATFMDPRNSLTASTVFQFEDLGFSSSCTVDSVESILASTGDAESTMYNKVIKGESVKYSQAIYNAGKKYDINPCFLASKIINEIGTLNNSAVNGKYSGYEGIYNFYNIGATDGAGAVGRGLKWAKTGTTYSRPWNTQVKSIEGGAEFLSEQYVAEGQYTGYLQKFQVNPDSGYNLYNHQYMTNVSGAYSQGYFTYQSYLGCGALASPHHFVIPIFKNMPGEKKPSPVLNFADTYQQTGKTTTAVNMRKGPSTSYATVDVSIPSGSVVTVLSKERTDSTYYLSLLGYPYWYKVKYKSYTGYIYSGYVNEVSETTLTTGSYTLTLSGSVSGHDDRVTVTSSDSSVATVSGNTLTLKKTGKATLTAFSPCGGFDILRVNVQSAASSRKVSSLSVKNTSASSLGLSWKASGNADGYDICVMDSGGKLKKSYSTTSTAYTCTSLSGAQKYKVLVRSYTKASSVKTYGPFSSVSGATVPPKVTAGKAKQGNGCLELSWNSVSGVDGYEVATYKSGKYTSVLKTKDTAAKIDGETLNNYSLYRVRAYISASSTGYGEYSGEFTPDYSPMQVNELTQSETTGTGYVLNWENAGGAKGYLIYTEDSSGKNVLTADITDNFYRVTGLTPGSKNVYTVTGYSATPDGEKIYAKPSQKFEAVTKPENAEKLSSETVTDGIKLKWSPADGCDGYRICTVDADGKYTVLDESSSPEYLMKTFDGKRKVAVCAYVSGSAGKICSGYSNILTVACKVGKPSKVKYEALDNGMRITWGACTDADGYCIELYDEGLGVYIPMLTTDKRVYTLFGLKNAQLRIRAYMNLSGGIKYSSYAEVSAKSK